MDLRIRIIILLVGTCTLSITNTHFLLNLTVLLIIHWLGFLACTDTIDETLDSSTTSLSDTFSIIKRS